MLGDSVNIGVIGAGYWGKKVITEYLVLSKGNPDVNLRRVCDIQKQSLRYCSEGLRIPEKRLTTNYKEIINSDDIHAVHICTPNETHYQICKEALMSRKHVLLEKPMTLLSQQAFELLNLAEKEDLVLQVGYIFRFNNALRKVRRLIKEGFLGKPYYLKFQWTTLIQPSPDRDIIFDLGPHPIDITNFLLGMWPTNVVCKAHAYTRTKLPEMAYATAELDGDIIVNLELSWLHPGKVRQLDIIGSKRSASIDCLNQKVEIFRDNGADGNRIHVKENNTILDELDNFIQRIRGPGQDLNSGHVGPMNVSVLESLKDSIVKNRTVKVDYGF